MIMTPAQFKNAIARLGLKQAEAAKFLGVGLRTVEHWVTGDRRIPNPAAILLRYMIATEATPEKVEAITKGKGK